MNQDLNAMDQDHEEECEDPFSCSALSSADPFPPRTAARAEELICVIAVHIVSFNV